MRALFVCHDFPPYRYAGAQIYARNLARQLSGDGRCEVEILYPVFRQPYPDPYRIHRGRADDLVVWELRRRIVGERDKVFDPGVYASVARLLREHAWDLVHVHGLGQLSSAPVHAAKDAGIPVVATLHDFWLLCHRWHMVRADYSVCDGPGTAAKCTRCFMEDYGLPDLPEKWAMIGGFSSERARRFAETLGRIDRVYSPSRFLSAVFGRYGRHPDGVIPYGFPSVERAAAKPVSGPPVFGYLGQIIPRKGLDILLQAFSRVSADARLQVWGAPNPGDGYGERIDAMARGDPRVSLHGAFRPQDLPGIYAGLDCAVIPTLMDNYPLSAWEAYTHRTPVVASATGGTPEIVRHGESGCLVPPGDPTALAGVLQGIAEDPGRLAGWVARIPGIPAIAKDGERYLAVYRELTGGAAAG